MIEPPPIASLAESIVLGSPADRTDLMIKRNEDTGPGFSFVRPSVGGAAETR